MNEEEAFLGALKGLTDPEDKRKAIGAQFIRTFEKMGKQIGEQVARSTIWHRAPFIRT